MHSAEYTDSRRTMGTSGYLTLGGVVMKRSAGKQTVWAARIALSLVFAVNMQCIVQFLVWPEYHAPAYALSGTAGAVAIRGLAVAFLMWNATYPVAIANPEKHRIVFAIVLAQQAIGLIGELMILSTIPQGFPQLSASILRFAAFDAAGFVLMGASFIALALSRRRSRLTDGR